MTQFRSKGYHPGIVEKPKPRPKTVKVTCASCLSRYYITIVGFAHEYVEIIQKTKCQKCGEVRLATNELAKTKLKAKTLQLSLDFKAKDGKD